MKIIDLKNNPALDATEKLIKSVLEKNWDAFKATKRQFIRNNQAYHSGYPGLIA
jgi:hypothetical protein